MASSMEEDGADVPKDGENDKNKAPASCKRTELGKLFLQLSAEVRARDKLRLDCVQTLSDEVAELRTILAKANGHAAGDQTKTKEAGEKFEEGKDKNSLGRTRLFK